MGFISLVDEVKFMLISNHTFALKNRFVQTFVDLLSVDKLIKMANYSLPPFPVWHIYLIGRTVL